MSKASFVLTGAIAMAGWIGVAGTMHARAGWLA